MRMLSPAAGSSTTTTWLKKKGCASSMGTSTTRRTPAGKPGGSRRLGTVSFAERCTAEQLALRRMPRLLLIGGRVEPAQSVDELEDWVRLPVADCDVRARVRRLRQRAAALPPKPLLDGCGRLIYEGRWVELAP